jgi:hypothetical protein
MLIYAPVITPRVKYIFQYLGEKTGIPFELTESSNRYKDTTEAKINYSAHSFSPGEFHIIPCGLLSENKIQQREIQVHEVNTLPVFFTTGGTLGFDLPAAIFYLISRYEEHDSFTPDEYGRYPYENSLAQKAGFLNRPLVDEWVHHFTQQLKSFFPALSITSSVFDFVPTYDIDLAWSYLHKGWMRNIGGLFKYPITALERLSVLIGIQKDPFDCYDDLHQLHDSNQLKPIYFFPVGLKRSSLDKHISSDNKAYRTLIQSVSHKATVGLHPSVYSNQDLKALAEEKKILEEIIGRPVVQSRQHYLRFTLPDTYRDLIKAGITDDYSMGYGTVNGFRASTSQSFLWYDLEREETTPLRIQPLAWMDANAYYESKLNAEAAATDFLYYQNIIQKSGGTFIAVAHNHLIATASEWKNWPATYHALLSHQ